MRILFLLPFNTVCLGFKHNAQVILARFAPASAAPTTYRAPLAADTQGRPRGKRAPSCQALSNLNDPENLDQPPDYANLALP